MSRTNQKEASQMKSHYTVQDLTKMALLTALISVSAYINIPLPFSPVTSTAQTLVVNMIAPGRRDFASWSIACSVLWDFPSSPAAWEAPANSLAQAADISSAGFPLLCSCPH